MLFGGELIAVIGALFASATGSTYFAILYGGAGLTCMVAHCYIRKYANFVAAEENLANVEGHLEEETKEQKQKVEKLEVVVKTLDTELSEVKEEEKVLNASNQILGGDIQKLQRIENDSGILINQLEMGIGDLKKEESAFESAIKALGAKGIDESLGNVVKKMIARFAEVQNFLKQILGVIEKERAEIDKEKNEQKEQSAELERQRIQWKEQFDSEKDELTRLTNQYGEELARQGEQIQKVNEISHGIDELMKKIN
jgi:chromosome segregation ATPase